MHATVGEPDASGAAEAKDAGRGTATRASGEAECGECLHLDGRKAWSQLPVEGHLRGELSPVKSGRWSRPA